MADMICHKVYELLMSILSRINERKAPGLDNIPNKLIKIAAEIISPSLTEIFARSISTGIFPSEWKTARVSPIFKKGKKNDRTTIDRYQLFQQSLKFSKK